MNASLRIAALVLSVAGLSACAGSMEKSTYVQPPRAGSFVTDEAYVSYVESSARRQGIGVTWVNVPTKRVQTSTQQ